MSTVRLKRLRADYQHVCDYVHQHARLQLIQFEGDPPERYQLEYRIRGLRQKDGELIEVSSHLVEISLPRDYPRVAPVCRMLTPVFHPNIAPHAICIGDHWSAGESLANLMARIGEMLAYQNYNTKSPLNGEAARWAAEHLDRLPLDRVSMTLDEHAQTNAMQGSPAPQPRVRMAAPSTRTTAGPSSDAPRRGATPPAAPRSEPIRQPGNTSKPDTRVLSTIRCPACASKLSLQARHAGHKLRCPKCKHVFNAPSLR